jgi:hypothetical protein
MGGWLGGWVVGWLGLALTSANRRISADFLHHFFLLFVLSFHTGFLAQDIFLIVKRQKVCVFSDLARRPTTMRRFQLGSFSADTNIQLAIRSLLLALIYESVTCVKP